MKIEVGKTYKNRRGEVLGPVESHIDEDFPFMTMTFGVLRTYTPEGGYYFGDEYDDNDLVEECNADGSPVVAQSNPLTADRSWRDEIALRVLPVLVADFLKDVRAGFMQADAGESGPQWSVVAKESLAIADEFIKVAKQS